MFVQEVFITFVGVEVEMYGKTYSNEYMVLRQDKSLCYQSNSFSYVKYWLPGKHSSYQSVICIRKTFLDKVDKMQMHTHSVLVLQIQNTYLEENLYVHWSLS